MLLSFSMDQFLQTQVPWLARRRPSRKSSFCSNLKLQVTIISMIFKKKKIWESILHALFIAVRWPPFLCVCSVFSSGSVQLHWGQWPPAQNDAAPRWFQTSKGLLGAGPSGIMAADVIITDSGIMHVAGVPLVNPSTVVVWEVMPGPGNGFQATTKIAVGCAIPPSLNPPSWAGFAPFAAYLFSLQEHFISEEKQGRKLTEHEINDVASFHCSPVSNFSAYVSPEAAAQSAATTTWGSGVTAVAFDPTRGGSVITVVIVEGNPLLLIIVKCRNKRWFHRMIEIF